MSVDEPIGSIVEDQLGFGKYAFVLAQFLARSPTPMTIGIHGEWGTGKSSLAHLIQELLHPRDREMNPKSPWRTDEELKALELPPEDEKDEARRRREREFDAGSKLKRLRADLQASGVDIDARLPDS